MRSKVTASLILVIVVAIVAGVINYQGLIAKNTKLVPKLGLDLRGGVRIVLEAQDTESAKATNDAINAAVSVIDKRVNALGVSEAVAVREGANSKRIMVELPGWEDPERAKEIIGKTALLEFKTEDGKVVVSGKNLTDAKLVFSQAQDSLGEPQIAFTLDAVGKAAFATATQANIGKKISIYLDSQVLMSPTVETAITDGQGVISGGFTAEQASNDALLLKSGSLPVKLVAISEEVVGPSLGNAFVRRSALAAVIAFLLVVIWMFVMYRYLGLVSGIALIIYADILMAAYLVLHATLSLPAIGGAILSIGMAVDANCIIFERIREELGMKKTVKSAIGAGFSRAFRAVFDSNLTVLVGTAFLFYFGSGTVRGFAVTLALGVLASMFTAVFASHMLVDLLLTPGIVRNSRKFLG
ncbi:protein translocase subunit SecD [Candidatus Cryosericum hinesii]|jgi:preprotein translocase subunit SecD|uniref:Protein translocase subunit SecD n=1 Tax=Candidatus Cryosericum hinesii TaxID=2290915 RepID=A0A398DH38_9BACT|nr:protein translocase subunit SecD [Candidatus Cryosericum hinesii]RIE13733.1 protein translocase subunit SecD [Candidatus Cryosericum hinesii]RIE14202.1 protein translocase subunit SecD [Candidatus Cryosericum hinesii]